MQPETLAFTDEQRDALSAFLDQFVKAGPPGDLPEDLYHDVQVLIARKIWELNPEIANAIAGVGSAENPPAILIKNVPVEDDLPPTPKSILPALNKPNPVTQSHYFSLGVGLIRYGEVMPASSMFNANAIERANTFDHRHENFDGIAQARPAHRDTSIKKNTVDEGINDELLLHTLRAAPDAKTPVIAISDLPDELVKRLSRDLEHDMGNIIIETEEGLRFHPSAEKVYLQKGFKDAKANAAAHEMFELINELAEAEEGVLLEKGDVLFIDQSRAFHAASEYTLTKDMGERRWVNHTRFKKPENVPFKNEVEEGTLFTLPNLIELDSVLERIEQHAQEKEQEEKNGWSI